MSNDNKNAGPGQPADAVALEAQTNSTACAKRLDLLIERSFDDLQFLMDEFSKLEVVLAPESQEALDGRAAEADSKLVKLRFFISHVRRTMARMRDARSGRDPLSMPQLAMLEEHIATSIAPVKERLVSQMDRAAARGRSGSTSSSSGGGGTRHEVSATDGEEGGHSTSRSSSVSSNMGGGFGGESLSSQDGAGEAEAEAGAGALVGGGRGGQEEDEDEDEWSVGVELSGDVFGTGGSVCLGLVSSAPTPTNPAAGGGRDCCSSSAFSRVTPPPSIGSPFSRLCWSGGCGGSGSGGLDLIGGGRTPLEHNRSRRDHLDMLSQLEAEGVFAADDSYSPCGPDPGMLGGVAFSPFMVSGAGKTSPSRTTGACGEGEGEDLSPVPLREVKEERDGGEDKGKEEEEESGGGGGDGGGALRKAAEALVLPLKNVVKQELSEEKKPAVAGGIGAVVSTPPEAVEATPVSAGATVLPERAAVVAPGVVAVAPSGAKGGASPAATTSSVSGVAGTPLIRPKCEPAAAASTRAVVSPCSHAAAVEARVAKPVAAAAAAAKEAAEEGAPTTPVFSAGDASTMAAPNRSVPPPGTSCAGAGATGRDTKMAAAAAVAVAPSSETLSSAGGGSRGGRSVLPVPPRPAKRRRSSTLPAALLQPREVRYQCGLCSQSYAATVTGNPWWLLVRQECPACHKLQIPRVDILNPTNNVERHIAFLTEACAETGSDGDDSFMDWDEDTSDDNSGDESGDERDAQGSSAAAGGGTVYGGDGGSGSGGRGRNGGLGASLDSEQAAKLLVLMCHARDCPGNHRDPRLAEVCQSVKFLMLHLRDCDGRTRAGQPCPFPWCQPCMSLLHHLIQCPDSAGCQVCNPLHLPSPLRDLRTLNHSSRASSPTQETPSPPPLPPQQGKQQPRPPPQQLQQHQVPHDGRGGTTSASQQQAKAGRASPSPEAAAASAPAAAVASATTVVKQETPP